jgi:hypothetical protein
MLAIHHVDNLKGFHLQRVTNCSQFTYVPRMESRFSWPTSPLWLHYPSNTYSDLNLLFAGPIPYAQMGRYSVTKIGAGHAETQLNEYHSVPFV